VLYHDIQICVLGTISISALSGVNTITGSPVVSGIAAASVGRPTGTVMIAVPVGIVIVIVVLTFDGRKQYPRSTQFNPLSPVYGALNVEGPPALVAAGVMRVDEPSAPILSQS
jgi:hypothetical protein